MQIFYLHKIGRKLHKEHSFWKEKQKSMSHNVKAESCLMVRKNGPEKFRWCIVFCSLGNFSFPDIPPKGTSTHISKSSPHIQISLTKGWMHNAINKLSLRSRVLCGFFQQRILKCDKTPFYFMQVFKIKTSFYALNTK